MVEKVTVRENAAPALSTDPSNNAGALSRPAPTCRRSPTIPTTLQPTCKPWQGLAGPNGGSIFVDGFSGGEIPPKASIREIRINQNPFSPEYDKLGYGKIEIFTKPGSDKYRATVDYNLGTQYWNSRNPYSPQKAPFLLDEFEGGGGGPLGKRASFTVDAQRNMVDNGAITNVVTVDPQTLAVQPFAGVFTTRGRYTKVTPRVDYQLNEKNTLMFRYGITHSDVPDNGIGGFDLVSRAYHSQFTNQTVQAAETAVVGTAVNETRFQYYRSATQAIANSLSPEIQVLGAFNGGGSQSGGTFDTQNSYELQNYTSMVRGKHSWRFGVRLRGQTDDSVSPQNFNGTFTFGGGADVNSIERYRRTLQYQQLGYSPAEIRALGGGATQFSINMGQAQLAVRQIDAGIFAGDDWRVGPEPYRELGRPLRNAKQHSRLARLRTPRGVAWAPARRRY